MLFLTRNPASGYVCPAHTHTAPGLKTVTVMSPRPLPPPPPPNHQRDKKQQTVGHHHLFQMSIFPQVETMGGRKYEKPEVVPETIKALVVWRWTIGLDQRLVNYVDANALINQLLAPLEVGHEVAGQGPQVCEPIRKWIWQWKLRQMEICKK
jgi:hypothetical protein